MISSLAVLSPSLLLLGLPVVAGLLYAYLRKGRSSAVVVASTLLLSKLRSAPIARKLPIPPLRFYFEVLALLLLVLGVSGLQLERPVERVALLIDNSLSMSAVPDGDERFGTFLERAKRAAEGALAELSSDAQVSLFVVAPTLQLRGKVDGSPGEALQELAGVSATSEGDVVEAAVEQTLADGEYDSVLLFTDKEQRSGVRPLGGLQVFNVRPKGVLLPNISLEQAAVVIGDQGLPTLQVGVRSFSRTSVAGTLSILHEGAARGDPLLSKPVTVPPNQLLSERFPVSSLSGVMAGERLLVRFVPGSGVEGDTLAADNERELVLPPPSTVRVQSELSAAQLGLSGIPGFEFLPATSAVDAAIEIQHRAAAREGYTRSTLVILPKSEGAAPVKRDPAPITRWEGTHPLLRYLDLSLPRVEITAPLQVPPWGKQLLASGNTTLGWYGELSGRRIVVLGFEILPYEGTRSPFASILLLNSLRWLAEGINGELQLPFPVQEVQLLLPQEFVVSSEGTLSSGIAQESESQGSLPLFPWFALVVALAAIGELLFGVFSARLNRASGGER